MTEFKTDFWFQELNYGLSLACNLCNLFFIQNVSDAYLCPDASIAVEIILILFH